MYAGRKVEEAPVEALFAEPLHPYTRGLMRAIPRLDVEADAAGTRPRLQEIPGLVPRLTQPIRRLRLRAALRLRDRALPRRARRRSSMPARGHTVACWEVDRVRASAP